VARETLEKEVKLRGLGRARGGLDAGVEEELGLEPFTE
jgi:hypothetical protein